MHCEILAQPGRFGPLASWLELSIIRTLSMCMHALGINSVLHGGPILASIARYMFAKFGPP